ncbi:MAG: Uma2 family endonuclease [Nocardiopsaceae bacterium]|nr:Uma2 family endonuclease [Nocardiopsaceae bacterium]
MDAPRTRRTDHARSDAWPEDAAIEELEEIFWSLGEFPGHRTELLEGRIVVSPVAVYWHSQVTLWLYEQFREACQANGWGQSLASDLVLPPTRDIVEPDHLIISDPAKFSDLRSDVPVEQALLVSEVVSPSSVRDDREVKPARYAKAKIPFYLLIDRLTEPSAITLFSEPGDSGYTKSDTAHVGPRGRRLIVPAPVEVTLDPMTMPIPRG